MFDSLRVVVILVIFVTPILSMMPHISTFSAPSLYGKKRDILLRFSQMLRRVFGFFLRHFVGNALSVLSNICTFLFSSPTLIPIPTPK